MASSAIRMVDVVRRFGTLRALDGLCLEVPRGVVFGFLGPNGAGKTTTLRVLLGLLAADAGEVEVLGGDPGLDGRSVRSRTGTLLEHPGVYERSTAEQNLDFFGRLYGMGRTERAERAEGLLRRLGLWDRRQERVGTWSLGMRKKLGLARALLHRPELLLLDEPSSGLDARAAALLRRDLAGLASREGTTIFLTTHNLTEAEQLCDAVAICRRGRVIASGTPEHLRADERPRWEVSGRGFALPLLDQLRAQAGVAGVTLRDDRLYLEMEPNEEPSAVVRMAVGAGAEVSEIQRIRPSLEEVFLELTEEE